MKARKLIGAAVVATAVIGTPAAASAQTGDYVGAEVQVRGVEFNRAPEEPVRVLGVQESREAGGTTLPVTGGDIAGLALLGAGAVALGTVLVRRGRTSSATA
ncbi:MAG: hypothetical protein M3394_10065 [Actinomycetota bacterium]|nr:hypothetical protein [Actinomycetota bacterium]